MRALIQRVKESNVRVGDEIVGAIGAGMTVLVGVGDADGVDEVTLLARKIATLRIFEDAAGKLNRSVSEAGGAVLVVSQFTLYADCRKGRRPSFVHAAPPDRAEPLITLLIEQLRGEGLTVATGRFRTEMVVTIVNDGPVTIWLDTDDLRGG